MLRATLQPHSIRAWEGLRDPSPWKLRVDLGPVGRCADTPDLTLLAFDGSGSIAASGGKDPVGNRYEEARIPLERLRRCRCGACLAGLVHFDYPAGYIAPGTLADREFQRTLQAGLRDPLDGMGVSLIGPSLTKATELAAAHPDHAARLVVFSDWELFDSFDYTARLLRFPGEVLAVGLGCTPPLSLKSESVTTLRIDHGDPPGATARALFGALVSNRPGATAH